MTPKRCAPTYTPSTTSPLTARQAGSEALAIGGGKDFPRTDAARREWIARLQDETHLSEDRLGTLLDRYGTRAEPVARFSADAPDEPLSHHGGYSRREIEFVIEHERVVHLDDLVLRRTALALLGELTPGLLDELAGIMAAPMAWPEQAAAEETARARRILQERHGIDLAPAG